MNIFDFTRCIDLYTFSSICINVSKYNNKYIALIKYNGQKKNATTYKDSYYLYFCLSDDGFNFKYS